MKTTRSIATSSPLAVSLFALLASVVSVSADWIRTAPGTYDYTDPANWSDSDGTPGPSAGDVNGLFNAPLSLTDDGVTGNQTLTFGADYTTLGALGFTYTDANSAGIPYNFTLRSDGVADRVLTLGGNLTFSPTQTARLLTIGSATANQGLSVNLGGVARTFDITSSGGTAADPGSGVTLLGVVSSGSIVKTGGGWLRLGGTVNNEVNGLTVSGGVVRLQKADGINAVGGNVLINGGTLLLSNGNQIPDSASVTLQSGAMVFAATTSTGSSNTPKAETIANLTVSGGTLNTSPKTSGSGSSATQTVTGTMEVSGGTISIRNGGNFTANRLKVTGSTVNVSTITSSSQRTTTLVIGSGGLEIDHTASGAYSAISIGTWARLTLGGNVVFNGNTTNTNTVSIAAAANLNGGATDTRLLSLNGASRTFTINDGAAAVDLQIDPDFTITDGTGTGGIIKAGLGTLEIASTGTYTGGTTVQAGRLVVSGSLLGNASVDGGTLSGGGAIAGTVTVNAGGTISPGNSPGNLDTGAEVWEGGGTYQWEINNFSGAEGLDPGWDVLNIAGGLTVNATSGNKFTIAITSLDPTLSNAPGAAANFNDGSNYQFRIADSTSEITTFDASAFNVEDAAFNNTFTGTWGILRGDSGGITGGDNTELYLAYVAVPEPGTWMLLSSAGMLFSFRRSRRH